MNKKDIVELFKVIKLAYPNFEVYPEKANFWQKYLADQNPVEVMKKAEWHIKNNPYPPTIADLRDNHKRNEDKPILAKYWSESQ
jgi:hypothetical protein